MIIIIRALSHVRKGWWRLWFPHKSGWDSGRKKEAIKNRGKCPNKKNERKIEKRQCYYPFTTLVLQSSTIILMIESLLFCHFHILVGIFYYRTWLVFQQWASSSSLGLRDQASWMHTHLVSFVELSYIYSCSASVAWQSLLLALTSIDGHLHSSFISLVDVRLSPFLSSPHNPHHYILLHP